MLIFLLELRFYFSIQVYVEVLLFFEWQCECLYIFEWKMGPLYTSFGLDVFSFGLSFYSIDPYYKYTGYEYIPKPLKK